ncbi:DUF5825 family protein [Streptomyces kunmingensis]|uniref:DUF5825 family protein n=1 Tax=Streptomyces kunmingensis TaxID=68225 RepID=A0ABU6CQW3_9ACTN|nr:DUF5825 family protein [Streptomyces kunmingensis]MEB3966814.1 DUF5825 family protein [Streptomyces kunmingensis]
MTVPPGTRPATSPVPSETTPGTRPPALPTTARPAPALPTAVPHRLTGTAVHVTAPLPLHGEGRATTQAVQFLRECLSHGLRVTYDAARPVLPPEPDTYNLRTLRHLPPPAEHPEEPAELTSWRTGHAYGMLYHRRGPGFITVMDRRERPASARFTLDHPDLLGAFDALHEATPLAALTPVHQEAAGLLADERLALVVDGWAVALPPRLRRWPVPCTGI